MTVPGKGGRPCLVKNPHVSGKIISMVANGSTQAEAARATNVSPATVSRVVKYHEQDIEEMKLDIQGIIARNVLDGIEKATRARLKDASNPTSRTGANSYRALVEGVGLRGRDVSVNVAMGAITVMDPERQFGLSQMTAQEREEEMRRLQDALGIV